MITSHYCILSLLFLLEIGLTQAKQSQQQQCGIYLAESTIPHAGLGMYSGIHFNQTQEVTSGDVIIPIYEIDWHNGHDDDWLFLWDDYTWQAGDFIGMSQEVEGKAVSAASTGIGAAINCRMSLVNVEASWNQYDTAGLNRGNDPGAGAISPYHDRRSIATRDILPGQELYISYGDSYFETRVPVYGLVPLEKNYDQADELIDKAMKVAPSITLGKSLVEFMANVPHKSRTMNAIPTDTTNLEHIMRVGTGQQYNSTRSIDWLNQHGKCMNNIKAGLSTIPGAGRGAFATRNINKGSVVAPAPLIHISDKNRFNMYPVSSVLDEDGKLQRNATVPTHQQLLINYCFGHANSTLLLSPYGMITGFINHASKSPNVKIEWSNLFSKQDEWFNLTVDQLARQKHAGLAFDYIALRDIQEGEEILLDYGDEWEDAWKKHVRDWKPDTSNYISAHELNNDLDLVLSTFSESPQLSDNVKMYIRQEYLAFLGNNNETEEFDEDYHPHVLDRYVDTATNETLYLIQMYSVQDDDEEEMTTIEYDEEVLFGVTRNAFYFRDEPYTRDHFLTTSFRHYMMIPDDMFPVAWKNIK